MGQQWIIRVQGREYGPVDIETLREWKTEGRLLPENGARPADNDLWTTAAAIPGLFESPLAASNEATLPLHRRSFGEIFSETFQIYRKGFGRFFCFSLLTAIPAFFLQLNFPAFEIGNQTAPNWSAIQPSLFSLFMLLVFVLAWPLFLAGIQLTTVDTVRAQDVRLRDLFWRSVFLWPRMAWLSLLVYGSYFIWSALPLVAALALLTGPVSVLSILLALAIVTFQVFMTARLWVNFMFWQQSAALGERAGLAALRESKTIARSRRGEPWLNRPLYRGAIIVSIWIVVAVIVSTFVQLPFVFVKLQGVTSLEQMQATLQNLASGSGPEPLMLAAYATSTLVHAAIRPLLGIAFVLLYFDSKLDVESDGPER